MVGALTELSKFLKGEVDATSSDYVALIAKNIPSSEADQRSFALRMIIHYVGDIH